MYDKPVLGVTEVMAALNAMITEANKEPARPLVFAIVDDTGGLIGYAKMDGIGALPRQIAIKKAYTAAIMGADTAALAERFSAGPMKLSDLGDPNLLALQGGVVIKSSSGAVLGAIGSSGRMANEDENVAKVGLAAMKL